jgi:hypothetical protein
VRITKAPPAEHLPGTDLEFERDALLAYISHYYPGAVQPDPAGPDRPRHSVVRLQIGRRWHSWTIAKGNMFLFDQHLPLADEDDPDNVEPDRDLHQHMDKYTRLLEHATTWSRQNPGSPPGTVAEVAPHNLLAMCESHDYGSTACTDGKRLGAKFGTRHRALQAWFHARCRNTCKFCAAQCSCACHPWTDGHLHVTTRRSSSVS